MKNLKILILGSLTTVNILLLGDSYLCQQYNEASNNTEITSECIETTSSEETFISTEETTNEILIETTSEDVIDDLEGYCYSDEDLYLLARVIDAEASDICTNEHKMCTGQVILNRMNSNKYPNTLREVVYDKGQYASVENNKLKKEISKESLEVARRLLNGEKILPDDVVYQAEFPQGKETVKTIYNKYLDNITYYCR